jgi:hypothetical protein
MWSTMRPWLLTPDMLSLIVLIINSYYLFRAGEGYPVEEAVVADETSKMEVN